MLSNTDGGKYMMEYDILRVLAIVGMVLIHVIQVFDELTGLASDDAYNGALPAVMFMFPMGVFIALSKNNTPKKLLTRGIILFVLGYVLSFLSGFLPFTTVAHVSEDKLISLLLGVDILQFAGLAFISFGVMKGFRLKDWHMVAISAIMLLISSVAIWFINIDETVIKQVYGLFIFCGGSDDSFPLMSWLIYPVLGYVFGKLLMKTEDRGEVYKKFFIGGIVGLIASVLIITLSGIGLWKFIMDSDGYYTNTVLGFIAIMSLVAIVVPALYFIQKRITKIKVRSAFRYTSKNLTPIYIMQWTIIGWLAAILKSLNATEVPVWSWFLIALIVLILCLCLTPLYTRARDRFKVSMNGD